MRRWTLRILLLALLVAGGFALRERYFAPEPVAVRVVPVERGLVEWTATNTRAGTVRARRRAGLSTGTSGLVTELAVRRGDRVEAGAVLLRLDAATQESAVLRAEQALELARARQRRTCLAAERERRAWERNEQLAADRDILSEDALDASRSAAEVAAADCVVAEAEVELARAELAAARVELEKTRLVAPFDAIIAEVGVEVGEWVTPSVPLMAAPDLIDAIDPTSLYVSAPMDEVDARLLSVGQPARVTIDSHPGESFPARVVRIAPYVLDVEAQNRTLEIEVELVDAQLSATLLPGTSADVEVLLETRGEVLRVPTWALLEGGRALVLEAGVLEERELETGLRNWDWTQVVAGLEEGELVVTSLDRPGVEAGADARREEGP